MKRLFIIFICIFYFSFIGCSNPTTSTPKVKTNKIDTIDSINISTTSPFTLSNESITPSHFIIKENTLIFPNWNDKNKISLIDKPLPSNFIKTEDINNFFDYQTNSMTILDETIYFSDLSNNYYLCSFNMATKQYTQLLNFKVQDLTLLNGVVYFINKDDNYSLYSYDTKTLTTKKLINNKIGQYIINNNQILYQNITDNSKLYKFDLNTLQNTAITDFSIDSFIVYNEQLLAINSSDNHRLYQISPNDLSTTRIALINAKNLKSVNNTIYYLNINNSNLYQLNYNTDNKEISSIIICDEGINEYYPTADYIFYKKSANINNNYVYVINTN